MFDIFGEFDSAEEINLAAEGLFNEGDMDNIYKLAEENGIDCNFAKMYIDGEIPVLADAMTAAMGKIDVELLEARKTYGLIADSVADYVKSLCNRETFAQAVRRKSCRLEACLKNMQDTAKKQVKTHSGCQCACIPPSEGFRMIREYYEKGTAS